MSFKVYRHVPGGPDEVIGRVEAEGKVYRSTPGRDDYLGRVDQEHGRIYLADLGPDDYVARVDPEQGKVHEHRAAARDRYRGTGGPAPPAVCSASLALGCVPGAGG